MSNDELPQSAERASAYLDGDLDATARAAASADPEVMAAVESFTRVRALMASVDPVAAGTKETAIAAALAEFDAIPSPHMPAVASAPVTSLQSRRTRMYRVLTGAAAAAIVGVVAIGALNSSRESDNDSAAIATDSPPATDPGFKIAADTEMASAETVSPSDVAGAADAASTSAPPAIIDSDDALEDYVAAVDAANATVMAAPADTASPPSPSVPREAGGDGASTCLSSDQIFLGPIVFKGTPAVAVRLASTGDLQAIADSDCRVLTEVKAP